MQRSREKSNIQSNLLSLCLSVSLPLCLFVALAEAAYVTKNPKTTPLQKLGRGVVNVVTGVLELPREIYMQTQATIQQGEYPFAAFPVGIVKGAVPGVVKALGRTGSGLYDIVSFPVEKPLNYQPLYQPATIFKQGNWTAPKSSSSP